MRLKTDHTATNRRTQKAQSYRYDIMVKVNPNWLRQICNDIILNCDSHDIINDPDVLSSLLTEKRSQVNILVFRNL